MARRDINSRTGLLLQLLEGTSFAAATYSGHDRLSACSAIRLLVMMLLLFADVGKFSSWSQTL